MPVLYALPWVSEATLTLLELREGAEAREGETRQRRLNLGAIASEFLTAVGDGDDRAAELATELANAVLAVGASSLARSVLEGGPLSITRAIRLGEGVLLRPTTARRAGAS